MKNRIALYVALSIPCFHVRFVCENSAKERVIRGEMRMRYEEQHRLNTRRTRVLYLSDGGVLLVVFVDYVFVGGRKRQNGGKRFLFFLLAKYCCSDVDGLRGATLATE